MKTIIGVESFEEMRERKLVRARKFDRREHVVSERRISFTSPADMLACLTPQRLRVYQVVREKPRSVSDLAATLHRDRRAVYRDVKALHTVGILKLRKEKNPGHGQVQMVEATAGRVELTATM